MEKDENKSEVVEEKVSEATEEIAIQLHTNILIGI